MKNLVYILSILLCISFTVIKTPEPNYQLFIFEGSDWCTNCIRLEKNVLNDSAFNAFLKTNSIELIKVDFPQRKILSQEQESQNAAIAEKYQFGGAFPTLVLARKDTLLYKNLYYTNQPVIDLQEEIRQSKTALQ